MMLFSSANADDRCPRCNHIGAVTDTDDRLGLIYECFYCVDSMEWQGTIHHRQLTWAIVNGAKTEVLG